MEIHPKKRMLRQSEWMAFNMAPHSRQSALRYPLTALLGSNANLRTARALFAHGGDMSAPLLVNHTGLAKASVGKALATLEAMGVVQSIGTGKTRLYHPRRTHPLYASLGALFDAERARFDAIIDAVKKAAADNGDVIAVWLYGSVARAEDSEWSDVDIAVATRKGKAMAMREAFSDRLANAEVRLFFRPSVVAIDTDDIVRLASFVDPWWTALSRNAVALKGDNPVVTASRLFSRSDRRR